MTPTSTLYRLIDAKLDGLLDEFVATRRPDRSWQEICDKIQEVTGESVNRETLRLWYVDRLEVEARVRVA